VVVRERAQVGRDVAQRRQQDVPPGMREREPVRQVVDVLGVHAKWMNSEARAISADAGEALLEPVLDRLDVVVGRRSIALTRAASAGENALIASSMARSVSGENGASSVIATRRRALPATRARRARDGARGRIRRSAARAPRPWRRSAVERRQRNERS
jgi:hypothetical protein